MAFSSMVDMSRSDEEKMEAIMPMAMPNIPDVPPGLCICLTEVELEKLDLEDDCDIGDMIDIRAFAEVTSVSKTDTGCRVELAIRMMAVENEMDEEPGED